jgi:hypothetical protein
VTQRGAFHEAALLDGRLRRLEARRARQVEAVESAYHADFMVVLQGAQPWLRRLVRETIAADPAATARLKGDLARWIDELDPHERKTDPPGPLELAHERPYPTMPRLPTGVLRVANDDDSNAEWGIDPLRAAAAELEVETGMRVVVGETIEVQPSGHRYPEPGEAATVLPTGEIVAAEPGP